MGLTAILGKLYFLQRFPNDRLERLAKRQHYQEVKIKARRGAIYDRNGRLLVNSVKAYSVYVNPSEISSPEAIGAALSQYLHLAQEDIVKTIQARPGSKFVWLQRHVPEKKIRQLWKRKHENHGSRFFQGVYVLPESNRKYSMGQLAGQILGLVDTDGKGIEGLEQRFNESLTGQEGRQIYRRNVQGRKMVLPGFPSKKARPGKDIYLTLDAVIQQIVEAELLEIVTEFKPKSAWVVVTNPFNGDILAMASEPSFDPSHRNEYSTKDLQQRSRNRLVVDSFEPGSTIKPLIAAAALNENLVSINTIFSCKNGLFGRRRLRDSHPHGDLNVQDIIAKSSNIGIAKVGLVLGDKRLYSYLQNLGFGQKSDIDFPGEAKGKLPTFAANWKSYGVPSVSMGQEISVTPIQLAMAYGTLANGGILMKPRLIKKMIDPSDQTTKNFPTRPVRRVFRRNVVYNSILPALKKVVEQGTAKTAQVEGYSVAGKTGTAQKYLPNEGGYSHTAFLSSFIAFAPAEAPRCLVYVGVDEPQGAYYGSKVAAPSVGKMIKKILEYFKVPEEIEVASR